MTKKDVAARMAELTGIDQRQSELQIDTLIRVFHEATEKNEPIFIRGLFTFHLVKRKAKKGQDIKNGKTIDIPAMHKPVFKVARILKAKAKRIP